MPALITKFVKVAQSGPTVDGRNIDPQWLRDMAETYDPALYLAKIWPDHLRWGNNYGSVVALKSEEKDGLVSLYASFAPNAQYLLSNQYDQKLSFSIEVLENFAGTGKFYLGGLGVTDSPASLGTDELKFSRRASYNGQGARIFAGEPVDASCFSTDAASDSAEAPSWFTTFINKFFHNEEPPMDQKQFDAMNKRMEGLEGQLGEIKSLVEGKFAAVPAAPAAPATEADPKPQGATSPDFSALTAAITASFETAMTPMRQKLDEMDKRFAAAKPGAPVAESTGPAAENSPLI